MDIKQDHYNSGYVHVQGEYQDKLPSDITECPETGHCKKVNERRAAYEANIATEHGLIELGKHMAKRENAKQKRQAKQLYLRTSVEELEDFNIEQFMSEVKSCKDKDLMFGKVQYLVGYVSLFKELNNHYVEDIADSHKEIESLKIENADMGEMVDRYIEEVNTTEKKLNLATNKYKKKFAEYSDNITNYEKKIQKINTDNQIYSDKIKLQHIKEKDEWVKEKNTLNATIIRLNQENSYIKTFTEKCLYVGISCGVVVIGTMVYYMVSDKTPFQLLFK